MLRRSLFALPFAAASLRARQRELRLSVRVEPLFPGLTLTQQIGKVATAGYQAFEFGDWRAADAKQITALKNKLGLQCANLVGNKSVNPIGMGLCDPAERDGFLSEIRASLDAAKRFEAKQMVVLSGFKVAHLSRQQQHASIVEGLKRAHDIVSRDGVTMILEVINTLAKIEPLNPKGNNHANYFLDRTSEAFDIVREVGSPNLKLLLDLYHVQIMEGNLIETLTANIAQIGHFHVGDVPLRHQPGTGEINYENVFRAISGSSYEGFVGMEYIPTKDAMETLAEVRTMAQRAAR